MTADRINMLRSLATDPAFILLCDIAEQEVMREFHVKLKAKNITESDEDRWRIYATIRGLPLLFATAMKKEEFAEEKKKTTGVY